MVCVEQPDGCLTSKLGMEDFARDLRQVFAEEEDCCVPLTVKYYLRNWR